MPGLPPFQNLSECLLRARINASLAPRGYNELRGSLWVRLLGPRKVVPKLAEFEGVMADLFKLLKDAAFADDQPIASDEIEALRMAKRWLDAACAEARRVLAA
jgi:hypothetical protein